MFRQCASHVEEVSMTRERANNDVAECYWLFNVVNLFPRPEKETVLRRLTAGKEPAKCYSVVS